jgi:hypothetical protein
MLHNGLSGSTDGSRGAGNSVRDLLISHGRDTLQLTDDDIFEPGSLVLG